MSPVCEAERQLLIALIELVEPLETPNNTHYTFHPNTLEEAAGYFHSLRVDWTCAYTSLADRGMLVSTPEGTGAQLTPAGIALARQERLDHPPIWYWYREYYTISASSRVYSRFCQELYGRDLCQTNFSDMAQIDFFLQVSGIKPDSRVLDLGCGAGHLAEYISDCTGAQVWGVDYVPEAIEQALSRTMAKRDRLNFQVGNFDHLDFSPGMFDLIVSIDTLYMPNDLPATLSRLQEMLAPHGRIFVFYLTMLFDLTQSREGLLPHGSELARSLDALQMTYRTWDFSEPTLNLMRRRRKLAEAMQPDFANEGTIFLYDHLITELDSGSQPYHPQITHLARYLYEISA